MAAQTWSDAELDALRRVGDPLADDIVAEIFRDGDIDAVRRLLRHCVENDHPLLAAGDDALPPELLAHVERYFVASDAELPELDPAHISAGENLFELHGPEVLMTLCCYSLPASYTARKGVQVLAQTGRLESHPKRRLIETTQMVIDVMSPGGLAIRESARVHGKGIRSAQKVRLMHAAIRRMILAKNGEQWLAEYDLPINQEDLAGTLMTFSQIVLDGLERIGAALTAEQHASYLFTWSAIGRIMGIREELIPVDLPAARVLTDTIKRRQTARSEAGNLMAGALLELMRESIPVGILRGLPATMLRFFLRDDSRYLALPRADWTEILVAAIHGFTRLFDRIVGSSRLSRRLYRAFNERFIAALLQVERGPKRADFDIPDHLARSWGIRA
jgi:ER-bound oxygenase mpaB/B'/Rubber oxygenase, catalytic domain